MSVQVVFRLPSIPVLREVGSIVIRHGQLDHVRRLAIKRLLGISINDAAYESETMGMSGQLDKMIRKKLKASKLESAQRVELLRLLMETKRVTRFRNLLVHSVWAREPRKRLLLRDKKALHPIPSITVLKQYGADIDCVLNQLNRLTRTLL